MMATQSDSSAESSNTEQAVSGQDSGVERYITGSRLDGDMFRLKVGSTQHVFLVHQRILAKSPVLARMTTSGFSESFTKEIILPEDDEDTFGRIVEFLYGNGCDAYSFDTCDEPGYVEMLTNLFALADKYDLCDLQEGIIYELSWVQFLREDKMAFFEAAHRFTQNSGDHYGHFHSFFANKADEHLENLNPEEIETLAEMVESDGTFAKWMFEAQMKLHQRQEERLESFDGMADDHYNIKGMWSKVFDELEKHPRDHPVDIQWVHDLMNRF